MKHAAFRLKQISTPTTAEHAAITLKVMPITCIRFCRPVEEEESGFVSGEAVGPVGLSVGSGAVTGTTADTEKDPFSR